METKPLIVIVGPTASGKTAAAIKIAERYNGEIICADSRTIYRGMDVGTAKPTPEERARVPHHGLDLVDPGQKFSVADFQQYTSRTIDEIRSRGNMPIIVGGSGLYVDAVVFDFALGGKVSSTERIKFERMSLDELYKYCDNNNIELPENTLNKRYVIRSIERGGLKPTRRSKPIDNCLIIGIATDITELRDRIELRSEQLFDNGVVKEAKMLGEKYGWDNEAMTGNIYPLIREYLAGSATEDWVREHFATLDWRLAKRQMTWFRRNPYIEWCTREDVVEYVACSLEPEH